MGQVKIYGLKTEINKIKSVMSEVIHSCIVEGLEFPKEKKFQRFFSMDKEDFYYPPERTKKYTIVEISIFEGRSVETQKKFIKLMFKSFKEQLSIQENDLEITITETPKANWGIRGLPGDELVLDYKVNV